MKIRLEGTPTECEQAAPRLAKVFDIVSVSDPYPNRGRSLLVRVYVEVRLGPGARRRPRPRHRTRGSRSTGPDGSCP